MGSFSTLTPMQIIIVVVLLAVVAVGIYTDVRYGKVRNWLTFPAMALGLVLSAVVGGLSGLASGLLGCLVGGLILFLPFALGAVGAGDVKLLAAVGAFLGPAGVFYAIVYGSLVGGVVALALLIKRGQLTSTITGLVLSPRLALTAVTQGNRDFPFAVVIGAGTLLVLLVGRLM